jgi:adenylate cyclase
MSPALAEQVVKEGGDRLGGVHLTVSTLFADIRNFTPMSEGMDAAEVVGMLNEYFSYMVRASFSSTFFPKIYLYLHSVGWCCI